jgi:hypothetical protein
VLKALPGRQAPAALNEFVRGIYRDLVSIASPRNASRLGRRLSAGITALAIVSLVSALLTLAPLFVGATAVGLGILYPSWWTDLYDRMGRFVDSTRSVGRDDNDLRQNISTSSFAGSVKRNQPWQLWRSDSVVNSRYHYFTTKDGRKRYYRTGQSIFGPASSQRHRESAKQNIDLPSWWPFASVESTKKEVSKTNDRQFGWKT